MIGQNGHCLGKVRAGTSAEGACIMIKDAMRTTLRPYSNVEVPKFLNARRDKNVG